MRVKPLFLRLVHGSARPVEAPLSSELSCWPCGPQVLSRCASSRSRRCWQSPGVHAGPARAILSPPRRARAPSCTARRPQGRQPAPAIPRPGEMLRALSGPCAEFRRREDCWPRPTSAEWLRPSTGSRPRTPADTRIPGEHPWPPCVG
eukprot:scaffold7947_cov403-Prasinococcus_capsulatus_cf.AAC.1